MCTVTRGDLPVAIHWFKDGRLLASGQYSQGLDQASIQVGELPGDLNNQLQRLDSAPSMSAAGSSGPDGGTQVAGIAIKQLDPYSSTLTFASLQAHHRGQYSCEATNEAGRANQSSTLVIHGEYLCNRITARLCSGARVRARTNSWRRATNLIVRHSNTTSRNPQLQPHCQ